MTTQRLHSNLAPIDLLTREELEQVLDKNVDRELREKVRGLDIARIPEAPITATGTTQNLFTGNDQTPWGPSQGDIWMVRRLNVKSSILTDTAKYILFRGSAPSDFNNAYTSRYLLEGFAPAIPAPVPSQPAVPASTVAQQNVNQYPVQVVLSGFTATAVFVNGIQVGVTNGTYTVPANGSISVTYSVVGTWVWSNLNVAIPAGQYQGVGYYPGTKAIFLQPGEQVYAQVLGATIGNQYTLAGECIRCPAEMKGKLL